MTVPTKPATPGELLENVFIQGDLSQLSEKQRTDYYLKVCESLGINPFTTPFKYIRLNNVLQLYATKDAAAQLRKINGISIKLVSQDVDNGVLTVHAAATDKDGREDEDIGAVNFADSLMGEARANAKMRAVTKAKRRVTLSIAGLGFLDETEAEDVVMARRPVVRMAPNVMNSPPHSPGADEATTDVGSVVDAAASAVPVPSAEAAVPQDTERLQMIDAELAAAAKQGWHALKSRWEQVSDADAELLSGALNRRHKPAAMEVERSRIKPGGKA